MKKFYIQYGIGKAKYVVNFYDGKKKFEDGSEFYDIKIFRNKKMMEKFVNTLKKRGYKEE